MSKIYHESKSDNKTIQANQTASGLGISIDQIDSEKSLLMRIWHETQRGICIF